MAFQKILFLLFVWFVIVESNPLGNGEPKKSTNDFEYSKCNTGLNVTFDKTYDFFKWTNTSHWPLAREASMSTFYCPSGSPKWSYSYGHWCIEPFTTNLTTLTPNSKNDTSEETENDGKNERNERNEINEGNEKEKEKFWTTQKQKEKVDPRRITWFVVSLQWLRCCPACESDDDRRAPKKTVSFVQVMAPTPEILEQYHAAFSESVTEYDEKYSQVLCTRSYMDKDVHPDTMWICEIQPAPAFKKISLAKHHRMRCSDSTSIATCVLELSIEQGPSVPFQHAVVYLSVFLCISICILAFTIWFFIFRLYRRSRVPSSSVAAANERDVLITKGRV